MYEDDVKWQSQQQATFLATPELCMNDWRLASPTWLPPVFAATTTTSPPPHTPLRRVKWCTNETMRAKGRREAAAGHWGQWGWRRGVSLGEMWGESDHRGLDNREVKPYRCFCSPAELCSIGKKKPKVCWMCDEDELDCRVSTEIQGRCDSMRSTITSMTRMTVGFLLVFADTWRQKP